MGCAISFETEGIFFVLSRSFLNIMPFLSLPIWNFATVSIRSSLSGLFARKSQSETAISTVESAFAVTVTSSLPLFFTPASYSAPSTVTETLPPVISPNLTVYSHFANSALAFAILSALNSSLGSMSPKTAAGSQ